METRLDRDAAARVATARLASARDESDRLFDIVKPEFLYERPIPERHRIVFYMGHLDAFDWNLFQEQIPGIRPFHPEFDRLFAFGIDPVDGGLPTDQPKDWPSLEQIRDYNARIRRTLDEAIGAAASEANLRRQALGEYNVLYFATHGLLPGELRCETEPGLALSPPPGASTTTADDGLLDASEVASLSFNAELVVLSACNTAAGGGRFGGEALSGLAEAFFYAGARTLIASHWQVPSLATERLMTGLFDRAGPRLAGGIAESLRQAQLAIASDAATAHPYYWAAFTVIGDGGRAGDLSAQASIGTTLAGAPAKEEEVTP